MPDYTELTCFECNKHLGWIVYSGPCGLPMCDVCREEDLREGVHHADYADAN